MSERSCIVLDVHRPFIVFHDDGTLSMEPLVDGDLVPITARSAQEYASMAWSSDCQWYFVVGADGIVLLNIYTNRGLFCRRRSAMFFDWFLRAPHRTPREAAP